VSAFGTLRAFASIALAIGVASAFAQEPSAQDCPELPAESGFAWEFKLGPDFFLCYAKETRGGRQSFGVYQGFAPSFRPENSALGESGVVGGHDVIWYAMGQGDDAGFKLARQTVFDLTPLADGATPKAHVWVYADTEEELAEMLGLLQVAKFNNLF
jgi:hypothetical protein